ncbi:MAG: hypothetical protein LBB68_00820 [Treponema sp.]|jgi:hypothetical protein|nr:hypothetical protein [Treponema sp.]
MSGDHHEHCHEHGHDHPHEHGGGHDHVHNHSGDLNKLTALLKYMADHNREHAGELCDLAHNLYHAGQHKSADVINDAVKEFEKGAEKLVEALDLIKDGN